MPEKEIVHIVPHSHWDREWYMAFEKHRYRLVKLIDSIIEIMERDPEYHYYHLDGQMIVLEDYLKIKPYMKDRLYALIHAGRIQIGPWYVLQDEYLISDEANVRNLLVGLSLCDEFGVEPVKIGYLPDSFGNISQMPQILAKCGIDSVVFGRGVTGISEVVWLSPDGSRVTGAHFAPWYNNANELPTDPKGAAQRAQKMLDMFKGHSKINHYLGMNGSDHQPLQADLKQAIKAMNAAAPAGVEFIHSSLSDYMAAIKQDVSNYPVVCGEMAGQDTNGAGLLISTASARIYLKQLNRLAQNALERTAEPLAVLNCLGGGEYPADFLRYSWKRLLENHAHDSICGCSVDSVHREMVTRFENVLQVADSISDEMLRGVAERIDWTGPGYPVFVMNTAVFPRTDRVSVVVDVPADDETRNFVVLDAAGRQIPCEYNCKEDHFTYSLPHDSFRQVEYVNRYTVTFTAQDVPATGYSVYRFAPGGQKETQALPHTERSAENEFIKLWVADDGSLFVVDKKTGREFSELNVYEDCADVGDEYIFVGNGRKIITTKDRPADISVHHASADGVTFRILQSMEIPGSHQTGGQSVTVHIKTDVTLNRFGRQLRIRTVMDNTAECHRIRAIFPNTIQTDTVLANGQFDVVRRSIQKGRSGLTRPTNKKCSPLWR